MKGLVINMEAKKYQLVMEGHFTGSKEYWKQEFDFDTIEEIFEFLEKNEYEDYKVYERKLVIF